MSDTVNKIKAELAAFNEKKKQLVEQLRTEFPSLLKPLFDQSDNIKKISWTQYSPYFNDGDECTFSAHIDYIDVNDEEYYEENDDEDRDDDEYLPLTENDDKIVKEITQVLQSVPEEFYEELFGNHVKVNVFRDGTLDVEEYDHD